MNRFVSLSLVAYLSTSLFCNFAHAWGGRGHHAICSVAPHLVKSDSLKEFLKFRTHIMGHLCNIPDIHWKALGSEVSDSGSPAHFIDPEVIGLKITEVPHDFKLIVEKYTGTENRFKNKGKIFSIAKEFGSLWWRADQFFKLISDLKPTFAETVFPKNFKEEQDDTMAYNHSVYNMMLYMGLMGHFVGDASQPFHSTADFDGYGTGNGGIHSYYEELVVTKFGPDMEALIADKAKSIKDKKLISGTPIEIMQHLNVLGTKDRDLVVKLDPVTNRSVIKTEKGMDIKTPAQRKSIDVGFAKFKDLIITQMARSSLALAHLWDESYHAAGSPSLQAYKSFRYPHTPGFIPPDYVEKTENKPKSEKK